MKRVNMSDFLSDPNRYKLKSGSEPNAPLCPFGNHYQWIGFDKAEQEFVRFTKSVFKKLVNEKENKK
ncbi:MAG: hypothetical protein R3E32_13355 [Chitinophagales bacterium]